MNAKCKALPGFMMITTHWLVAQIPAPSGSFDPAFAFPATIGYALITMPLFFSSNRRKV